MTKFLTQCTLCPISNLYDFCGVCADKIQDTIITTVSKNIILIDIKTQRQVKSWSTLEKLCSKVHYDKQSDKYVGVFGNNILRCWSYDTTSINKSDRYQFQKYIADLISDGGKIYVLYYDGSCQSLQEAMVTPKKMNNASQVDQFELVSKYSLLNGNIFKLPNGDKIVTYFQLYKETYEYNFIRMNLNGDRQVHPYPLLREDQDYDITGATVIEGDGVPILLTIWSDRRMFALALDNNFSTKFPGTYIANLPILDIEKPMSIAAIEGYFLAIYGANENQCGASLLLYNAKYMVLKAVQHYEQYFHYIRMWVIRNYVVLAMGQQLSAIKYKISKELLSELLGTQIGMTTQGISEGISEEDHLEDYLKYSNVKDIMPNIEKTPPSLPIVEDDMLKPFISGDEFDQQLKETYLPAVHADIIQTDDPLDTTNVRIISNASDNNFICPNIQIMAEDLEQSGSSQEEISEKLLDVLLKTRNFEDIHTCLKRYNIVERMLSRTLGFILSLRNVNANSNPKNTNFDEQIFDFVDLTNEDSENELEDEIINTILCCTFDTELIIAYIREYIDYEQSLLLLKHMYNLLINNSCYDLEKRGYFSWKHSSVQYELQILRWFGILMDANFQKLVLNADMILIELISKWNELFIDYRNEFMQLQDLYALLHETVEMKSITREDESLHCYSIEEVHLF